WDYMYYRLIALAAGQQPLEQELLIELAQHKAKENSSASLQLVYAGLAILSFHSEKDREALAYIQQCSFDKVQRLVYPMIEQRMQDGQWAQVSMWMTWLQEKFKSNI